MKQITSYTAIQISEFLEMLSSDIPTLPAAGSALGLSGAIAASLSLFVSRLVNKNTLSGDIPNLSQETINQIIDLQHSCMEIIPDASKADAFIAAEMAYACLKGTAYIVQVNVQEIKTKQIETSFLTHMQNNLKNGKSFYENIINSNLYSVENLKE